MTEDQIERRVSEMLDCAESAYLAGKMTPEQYRRRVAAIDRWADLLYRRQLRRRRTD